MANRLWAHFFNVGIVDPVDDLRASNPPSNPELFAVLKREFAAGDFDLKSLMRLILTSKTYQRSSTPVPGNESDERFYSRCYPRRMPAEVLLDALSQATESPTIFKDQPRGTRSEQLLLTREVAPGGGEQRADDRECDDDVALQ